MTPVNNNIHPQTMDLVGSGSSVDKSSPSSPKAKIRSTHFLGRAWTKVKGAAPVIAGLFLAALMGVAWHLDKQRKLANAKLLDAKDEPSSEAPTTSAAASSSTPVTSQANKVSPKASPKTISTPPEKALEVLEADEIKTPELSIVIDDSADADIADVEIIVPQDLSEGESGSPVHFGEPFESNTAPTRPSNDRLSPVSQKSPEATPRVISTLAEYILEINEPKTLQPSVQVVHLAQAHDLNPIDLSLLRFDAQDAEEFCNLVMKEPQFKEFPSHKLVYSERGASPGTLQSFEESGKALRVNFSQNKQPTELSDLTLNERTNLGAQNVIFTLRLQEDQLPTTLPIQLKRYNKDERLNDVKKDSSPIIPSAEILIPLAYNEKTSAKYVLGSCIVHSGQTSDINQDYCYTYNREVVDGKEQWTKSQNGDSSLCDEATAQMDIQNNGYLFFYKLDGVFDSK